MLFMGKSTISMTIFNSKLLVYQRVYVINDYVYYLRAWDHCDSINSIKQVVYANVYTTILLCKDHGRMGGTHLGRDDGL